VLKTHLHSLRTCGAFACGLRLCECDDGACRSVSRIVHVVIGVVFMMVGIAYVAARLLSTDNCARACAHTHTYTRTHQFHTCPLPRVRLTRNQRLAFLFSLSRHPHLAFLHSFSHALRSHSIHDHAHADLCDHLVGRGRGTLEVFGFGGRDVIV
jgi:hypothetical protein